MRSIDEQSLWTFLDGKKSEANDKLHVRSKAVQTKCFAVYNPWWWHTSKKYVMYLDRRLNFASSDAWKWRRICLGTSLVEFAFRFIIVCILLVNLWEVQHVSRHLLIRLELELDWRSYLLCIIWYCSAALVSQIQYCSQFPSKVNSIHVIGEWWKKNFLNIS